MTDSLFKVDIKACQDASWHQATLVCPSRDIWCRHYEILSVYV